MIYILTFNLICVGVCDVASLYPYSHRTLCSSVLAQQFHLQEAGGAGPHTPEDGPEIPPAPRDETRRGINYFFNFQCKCLPTFSVMKTVHFPGRVSMMIVLMYLLCHSPKLILTFCEIMFKNPKAS